MKQRDIGVDGTHGLTEVWMVNNLGPNDWAVPGEERGQIANQSGCRVPHVSRFDRK